VLAIDHVIQVPNEPARAKDAADGKKAGADLRFNKYGTSFNR